MRRSQERVITATFAHISELLDTVSRLAREDLSPFSKERPDLSPYESRMVLAFSDQLRGAMLEALTHLGIARPQPQISARWSVTTTLLFVDIALAELTPSNLQRYGELDGAAAAGVTAVAAELASRVAHMRDLLRGSAFADLEERVATVPGIAGRILRELLALARNQELVELYPEIAAVTERALSPLSDVGIFGRISAGKSSLVNALIGTPVLPVGATPVSALPLRVSQGDPSMRVRFVDGRTETHDLADVATFAAQSENPDNRRGVAAVDVFVPTAPAHFRFLDTPGVGSYTRPGTSSAFAWLPRCDLGLVLVAAGNAVDPEDLALLSGLQAAGVEWRLLLSKCDLLTDADLADSVGYVNEELERLPGFPHPALLTLSTAPGSETGLDRIWSEVLQPLERGRAASSRHRLQARLEHIVISASAALNGKRSNSVGDAFSRRTILQRGQEHVRRLAEELSEATAAILEEAAAEAAAAWQVTAGAEEAVQRVLVGAATGSLAAIQDTLAEIARQLPGAESIGEYAMPPIFSPASLLPLPDLSRPRLGATLIGRKWATRRLEPWGPRLAAAYRAYGAELRTWAEAVLERIGTAALPPAVEHGGGDSTTLKELRRLVAEVET